MMVAKVLTAVGQTRFFTRQTTVPSASSNTVFLFNFSSDQLEKIVRKLVAFLKIFPKQNLSIGIILDVDKQWTKNDVFH